MGRKRASQVDASGQRINCKVCGSSAVGRRCGAVVCEACKKFFIRNRNSLPKLRCVNESNQVGNSSVGGEGGSAGGVGGSSNSGAENNNVSQQLSCEITPNNRCCSRCRIIKCLELGMRMKGKKTKSSSSTAAALSNSGVGSPAFSLASAMSPAGLLKDHGSVMSVPPPPSVSTPSMSDPTVDLYIPKKHRAAMTSTTAAIRQQQSPFNAANSTTDSGSPPWMASPSPPPLTAATAAALGGKQQDRFAAQRASLPVFPSLMEELRGGFPLMNGFGNNSSNNNNNSAAQLNGDQQSMSPDAPSSSTSAINGFLAYQKFAREMQARGISPGQHSGPSPNSAFGPSSSSSSFSSSFPSLPPTSLSAFFSTVTASVASSAASPSSPSQFPKPLLSSPPWGLATSLLARGISSDLSSIHNNQQAANGMSQSADGQDGCKSPSDDNTDGNTDSSTMTKIMTEPANLEAMANEAMLRGIVRAFPSLQFSSKQLELDVSTAQLPSPHELWQMLMGNFEDGVGMGLSYVKSLPGVRQINIKDRSEIFSDSFLPMAAAQQLLDAPPSRPDGFFLNMSQDARNLFLSYFPAYTALAREVHDIGEALSSWNPSFIEFVFLEAMLFYRSDVPNLQNPLAVCRLRTRLTRTLEAYLQKTCRTEDEAQGAMRQFYTVYNLLMKLPDVHNAVLSQTAREHPEIFGVSALLGELYGRTDGSSSTSPSAANNGSPSNPAITPAPSASSAAANVNNDQPSSSNISQQQQQQQLPQQPLSPAQHHAEQQFRQHQLYQLQQLQQLHQQQQQQQQQQQHHHHHHQQQQSSQSQAGLKTPFPPYFSQHQQAIFQQAVHEPQTPGFQAGSSLLGHQQPIPLTKNQ